MGLLQRAHLPQLFTHVSVSLPRDPCWGLGQCLFCIDAMSLWTNPYVEGDRDTIGTIHFHFTKAHTRFLNFIIHVVKRVLTGPRIACMCFSPMAPVRFGFSASLIGFELCLFIFWPCRCSTRDPVVPLRNMGPRFLASTALLGIGTMLFAVHDLYAVHLVSPVDAALIKDVSGVRLTQTTSCAEDPHHDPASLRSFHQQFLKKSKGEKRRRWKTPLKGQTNQTRERKEKRKRREERGTRTREHTATHHGRDGGI